MSDLGYWLVSAREARGLTLEDAERDTRISRRYLQALEDEQFDIIPAPVYARGFLRSYAQYLGLDPREAMARFPREDDGYVPPTRAGRTPSRQSSRRGEAEQYEPPAGPPPANRPTWRRPTPLRVEGSAAPADDDYEEDDEQWEPMIGVDIGVPVPTRRLDRDPAAQTRTAFVVGVAIAAIVFVIALALIVSRLGGGDDNGSPLPDVAGAGDIDNGAATEEPTPEPTSITPVVSSEPGTVPPLEGLLQDEAVAAIRAAGYVETINLVDSDQPAGTVVGQSPAEGFEHPAGANVSIAVSRGPE